MTPFEEYLIQIGYNRYRKSFHNKKWEYTVVDNKKSVYSTMVSGELDYRYFLNGDESSEIIFGLHEKGLPPTLIYPRPKGVHYDDEMNRMLKEMSPEDIYKLIKT